MSWFIKGLSNYAVFSGRARRKEYWMYILFYFIFSIPIGIIDGILMAALGMQTPIISYIYALGLMIPTYAVTARRLHDIGKSGFWIFFGLVPIVGSIVLLIFTCMDGEPRTNQYGPDPKGRGAFKGDFYNPVNSITEDPYNFD